MQVIHRKLTPGKAVFVGTLVVNVPVFMLLLGPGFVATRLGYVDWFLPVLRERWPAMALEVDITEAQQRFLELIRAVERGEAVIITKNMHPVVHMIAAAPMKKQPTFGSARGLMTIADDFDAPLDDFREYQP